MAETWVRETTSQWCSWTSFISWRKALLIIAMSLGVCFGGRFGTQDFIFSMLWIQDGKTMERALDASIDIALIGLAALLLIYRCLRVSAAAPTPSLMLFPRAS